MVDCIEAFQEDADDPIEVINACETEEIINACVTEDEWFLDSGASSHVTGNPKLLSHMSSSTVPHIRTAGGQAMPIARQGSVNTTDSSGAIKTISQILYVLGVMTNLLSIGRLTDIGYTIVFETTQCIITDTYNDKAILLQGTCDPRNNLYRITSKIGQSCLSIISNVTSSLSQSIPATPHIQTITVSPLAAPKLSASETRPSTRPSNADIHLWHKRIGHINYQGLYHMTSKNLVAGVPAIPLIKHICSSCMLGKLPHDRIPKRRKTFTTRPLQLIHSDLCGPMPIHSRKGNRYILTFIDDFSMKTWLYFIADKTQTLDCFKKFRQLVETSTHKIGTLRSDRGGEYLSTTFNNYLAANGIQRQLTAGYSPHQNGVAKRKNRTLLEGIRSVVTGTKIPKALWKDLAYSVNYIQNRWPTKALKLKTPEEVFTGIKPHLGHLRVIGCLAYCHIPDVKRQKLDPKATATIFIGYDEQSKAYRCYHPPSRKILVSRDVRFDEQQFAIPSIETTEPLEDHSFLDRLLSHTKPMTQPICIPLHSTTVHPPQTPQSVLLPGRTQHSTHSHNTSLTIPQPSNLPTQFDPVTPTSNPTSINPPSDSLESPLPESNLPEVLVVIPRRSECPQK